MKKIFVLAFCLLSYVNLSSCSDDNNDNGTEEKPQDKYSLPEVKADNLFNISGNGLVSIDVDDESLVRNPCMGWGLYDDAQDYVSDASVYWMQMDEYAKYATHLYIRWRWSEMEPEEGKYVWLDKNSNFTRLVNGALKRGLKLAFRVYYDSNGQHRQATPDYVRQAGAEGTWYKGWGNVDMWSPYVDDPVFHEKLDAFVKAFAAEFDDPDRVDFVDGFNLGYWGEGHHLSIKAGDNNETAKTEVVKWITTLYGNAFKKVPLVINYHQEIGESNLDWVLQNQDYQLRHDAFGSTYYGSFEKNYVSKYSSKRMIVAESCYWFVGTDKGAATTGGVDYTEQWRLDNSYNPKATSWAQVYQRTYNESAVARANTLDMREVREAQSWTSQAPGVVQDFISNGGYRFTPVSISFPAEVAKNGVLTIGHKWKNSGFGVCPNNNKRWNNKYKAAFALVDSNENIAKIFVDNNADPSEWLKETDKSYKVEVTNIGLSAGEYYLAAGVSDTSKDKNPLGLNLACKSLNTIDGWQIVGKITIK